MRINNNLMAINTHRQLGISQGAGAKSMEKLSSGLRINRAGDDAAGLAISEKMRGQIRGLNQASRNSADTISLIQTAEGALNETNAILQRMRELAVQAANDTNTEEDRAELQSEVAQLIREVDRIGNTTEFNTKKLLDGSAVGVSDNVLATAKLNQNSATTVNIDLLNKFKAEVSANQNFYMDGAHMLVRVKETGDIENDYEIIGPDGASYKFVSANTTTAQVPKDLQVNGILTGNQAIASGVQDAAKAVAETLIANTKAGMTATPANLDAITHVDDSTMKLTGAINSKKDELVAEIMRLVLDKPIIVAVDDGYGSEVKIGDSVTINATDFTADLDNYVAQALDNVLGTGHGLKISVNFDDLTGINGTAMSAIASGGGTNRNILLEIDSGTLKTVLEAELVGITNAGGNIDSSNRFGSSGELTSTIVSKILESGDWETATATTPAAIGGPINAATLQKAFEMNGMELSMADANTLATGLNSGSNLARFLTYGKVSSIEDVAGGILASTISDDSFAELLANAIMDFGGFTDFFGDMPDTMDFITDTSEDFEKGMHMLGGKIDTNITLADGSDVLVNSTLNRGSILTVGSKFTVTNKDYTPTLTESTSFKIEVNNADLGVWMDKDGNVWVGTDDNKSSIAAGKTLTLKDGTVLKNNGQGELEIMQGSVKLAEKATVAIGGGINEIAKNSVMSVGSSLAESSTLSKGTVIGDKNNSELIRGSIEIGYSPNTGYEDNYITFAGEHRLEANWHEMKTGLSNTFDFKAFQSGSSDLDNSFLTQAGANSGQIMFVSMNDMRAKALGVDTIDVSTKWGAATAVTLLDNATAKVSHQRATLGAMQNRLEATIRNLDTTAENLQASESRVRDVDMAKEIMENTKQNILQQASQAMLAQANQAPQSVLQLLR